MLKIISKVYPSDDQYADYKATLRFILAYPRRVYTNLFPSAPTWWLLFMLVVLNGVDWAAFELLNIGNAATSVIPTRFRVLDGLFQALAVRSGGFYIISITSLRIGLQVLYVIMMYISVYPVVITMRHSNVYEERSLGIYADDEPSSTEGLRLGTFASQLRRTFTKSLQTQFPSSSVNANQFVRQQVRGQLAHDIWWLVIAILLISCIEVGNFDRDPVTYSVFNITFEVVSAYGCVGISTGLPNEAYSFSGGFHICSKLIMCAVMLRGRHRGLPVALDRAVRLPGAGGEYGELEEEDWFVKQRRSMSMSREGSVRVGLGLSALEL
jgi:Trk-type K+ transport system membrane component